MSLAAKPLAKRQAYLTEEGAFLGPGVPLLERDETGHGPGPLRPRSREVLKSLLTRGYGAPVDLGPAATGPRARQLQEIAKALNRGDLAKARIHLQRMDLPPLPSDARAEALAEADRTLRQEDMAKVAGMGLGATGLGGRRDHYLEQDRDYHGRWTRGGGGGATLVSDKKKPAKTKPVRPPPMQNPGLATREGNTVSIQRPDGTIEDHIGGTRAGRNNNPGNIGAGDFAYRHGAIGREGNFAIFPDEATGTAAQKALLLNPDYRKLSVDDAVKKWAPPNENDTEKYQQRVRDWTGLKGTEKIGDLTEEQLDRFMKAQRRMEGWDPGKIIIRPKPPQLDAVPEASPGV